ncbi:MAG: hypothetical protein AB4372_08130, partial [Xenococcus sp. (in: cyanobacteria)]
MSTSQYFPVQAMKVFRGIILLIFMLTLKTSVKAQNNISPLEKNGFVVQFEGCRSTPNSDVPLTCDFLVKISQQKSRRLHFYGGRIIDANGNVINDSFIKLGNDVDDNSPNSSVRQEPPIGIPIKASVSFPQAPEGNI